jgi:hypothetical protein
MKKILFVMFAFMAVGVQAQMDTMGKYPYLYYYNWPETGVWYGTDYCGLLISGKNIPYHTTTEFALYQHTDTPLEIVGLAIGWGTGGSSTIPGYNQVKTTLYDSAMNEMDSFHGVYYEADENTLNKDTSAHLFFYPGYLMRRLPLSSHIWDTNYIGIYNYVYFRFFDSVSYTLTGDFYIGLSYDNFIEEHLNAAPLTFQCIREIHDSLVDLIPTVTSHYTPTAARYKMTNEVWSELVLDTGWVPVLFAIVKVPCVAVDSMTVTVGPDGCLRADWVRPLPLVQSAWQVRLVMPNGSEVMQSVDTNHWEYCGLSPNLTYTVYLRSQCDKVDGGHEWSDWSGAFYSVYSSTQSLADVGRHEAAVTLRPNPATDEVTVAAEGVAGTVTVSVMDMAGAEVLRHEGARLPLTMGTSSLAAGTYVVRVTTTHGTAVQKLTVVR